MMPMAPRLLVSTIIPCFNHGRFLAEAIDSALGQTYPHIEVIVVDDGSTDNTWEVAQRYDGRVRYIHQRNAGLSAARNTGVAHARGRLIQFLDADDALLPLKVERQVKEMEIDPEAGASVAYCSYYLGHMEDDRMVLSPPSDEPWLDPARALSDLARRWESGLSIPIHCYLFDTRLFHDHHVRFDESLPNHEDWDCWMTLFTLNPRIIHVDEPLVVYRQHPQSMTQDLLGMRQGFLRAIDKQRRLHQADMDLQHILHQKIQQVNSAYGGQARQRAWHALRHRQLRDAWRWYYWAIRIYPRQIGRSSLRRDMLRLLRCSLARLLQR